MEAACELVIPSAAAAWFDQSSASQLEKDSLPEFFSGLYPSKSPAVYLEYRSFMIALYQMQPDMYLTATACRRHLSGDACAILRVHQFLETHGLINFQVRPDEKPLAKELLSESRYNRVFINAANKHFIDKNQTEYLQHLSETVGTSAESPLDRSHEGPKTRLLDAGSLRKLNLLSCRERPVCGFCGTLVGFTWQAGPQYVLCNQCHREHKFPAGPAEFRQ